MFFNKVFRFYHGDESRCQAIIEAILLNSSDLFRLNLPGINILFPLFFGRDRLLSRE